MGIRSAQAGFGTLAKTLGGVFTIAEARSAGFSFERVRWAVASGVVRRLRHGVYTTMRIWEQASAARRHQLELMAHLRVNRDSVGWGLSAAMALELPLPGGELRPAIRRRADGEAVIRVADGVVVTSGLVTVMDSIRRLDREWGLAMADAASSQGLITPGELVAAAASLTGSPGAATARWVAAHVRPEAESPLESLARATIVMGGYPEPLLQHWIKTERGAYRVDLFDPVNRIITEADGKLKYSQPEDLWREKRREDALRAAGNSMVRFAMADLYRQAAWLDTYGRSSRS